MVRTATPLQDSSSDERLTEQVEEPTAEGSQEQGRRNVHEPTAKVVVGTKRKRKTERVNELPPRDCARLGQSPSKRSKMLAQEMVRALE